MDEVLEQFENVLSTNPDSEPPSNFEGLYKNWGKLGNQEERRKEILEIQKTNRKTKLDKFRGILELVNAVEQDSIFKGHSRAYYRPTIYVAGFNRTSVSYSNVLMMSEWIIEKPADFNENWYVVPCPKGVRLLVVANQGSTKCYSKYGQFRFELNTALPGGNKQGLKRHNQCCVLDCFYDSKINTMFVVDLLAWNSQPMTDGETEFRHYWMETQLAEIPYLKSCNKRNEVIFKILPKIPCETESFQKFMKSHPPFPENNPLLDGLLFYHKRAHYFAGQTPLVGWLYPYMVPEVLGSDIEIHGVYATEKPESYVSQADFIEKFEAKNALKSNKRRSRRNSKSMDTADLSNNEVPAVAPVADVTEVPPITEIMEAEVVESAPVETGNMELEPSEKKPEEQQD